MTMVNHQNIANEKNQVYCCLRNKIVQADIEQQMRFCAGCQMYQGNAGGAGIECRWEDLRTTAPLVIIHDPVAECVFNQSKLVSVYVAAAADSDWSALCITPTI